MTLSVEAIQAICDDITREVEKAYEGLSLYFVIHGQGKMRDAIALAEHEIVSHPSGNAARAIVKRHTKSERSAFLGIAIASKSKMLGFKKEDSLLALFNINKDHYRTEEDVRGQVYHLVWHAIDLYEIRQEPAYKRKFKSGPMVPKRSPLNLSKANLQADVFTSVVMSLKKHALDRASEDNIAKLISRLRGVMSLNAIHDYKAEDYPSVIAVQSCEIVVQELLENLPPPEEFLSSARRVSLDVGHAYDENNIKQWWDFSIPAQDMAWRGFTREEILGAALNTSDNPFVRSVGYLIHEVTNVDPVSAASLEHSYNAFVDPEMNMKLHREMVDTIFEEAITKVTEESDTRALKEAANLQNEQLTDGRILGWCASALQDAARAFENAVSSGKSPDQAARLEFEGNRDIADWETLTDLGNKVVEQKRQGVAVTMGHIAEICNEHPAFAPVLGALKITMNDPSYVQKLEAANDLSIAAPSLGPKTPGLSLDGPELKGPAPKAPGPKGPAPTAEPTAAPATAQPAAAGPTLGGNNRAKELLRQRQLAAQRQKEQQDSGDGKRE